METATDPTPQSLAHVVRGENRSRTAYIAQELVNWLSTQPHPLNPYRKILPQEAIEIAATRLNKARKTIYTYLAEDIPKEHQVMDREFWLRLPKST